MDSIFEVRWSKQFCPRFCPMKTEKVPIGRSLPSCCCSSWPFLGGLRCGLLSCPQLGTCWVHPHAGQWTPGMTTVIWWPR